MSWMKLVHLGDLALILPAAAAMTAWMAAARAWRMAFWWSLLFALAIGLVGATKIAFLGWGGGLPALGFRAFSGHTTGVTAVFPTLFYLMLQQSPAQARQAGVAAGLLLGAAMAVLLVALGEHTLSEALGGWAMGALVSLGGIRMAGRPLAPARPMPALACFCAAFLSAAWIMKSAPVGYWMIKAALLLSGNRRPFSWDICG
jgi:hypothetical protein